MKVGDTTLEPPSVQRDGLVEIPWSIGGEKNAFKDFAETLAAAIPGAIVYETPKLWVVSKPGKRRVNVLELLEAAPALRSALEAFRLELLAGGRDAGVHATSPQRVHDPAEPHSRHHL